MEEPQSRLGITPFDEDPNQARSKSNKSTRRTSRDTIPSSPSSSSAHAADAAMKIGSSISDLGQHLFHQVDRVSSRLIADAGAYGFFSDENQQSLEHGINLPPPSPFVAVATDYSTTTDEHDSDTDYDDDDDDDDKTVQMDNTATNSRRRRIARLKEDKRAIEQDKGSPTGFPPQSVNDDMPSVSPSSISSSPRYRDRRDVTRVDHKPRRARRALTANMAAASVAAAATTATSAELHRIPELRDSGALMDESSFEDDGSVASSLPAVVAVSRGRTNASTVASRAKDVNGSGDEIEASYLAAYDTDPSGIDGSNSAGGRASAITVVHSLSSSIRGLATSVLSVSMSNTAGENGTSNTKDSGSADPPGIRLAPSVATDDNNPMLLRHRPRKHADDAESDTLAHGTKRMKKCRLTKLRIAGILLCLFAVVIILAAVLRPDKSNLRGVGAAEADANTNDTAAAISTTANSTPPAPGDLVTTERPATALPTGAPTKAPIIWTSTGLPPLEYLGTLGTPKGLCQGDCDSDDDCLPDLVCHRRDGYDRVPGCDTMPGTKDVDYCALPGGTQYPTVAPVATTFPTQTPTTQTPKQTPTKKPKEAVVEKETKDDTSFSFYVMSNGPYNSDEEKLLATQLMDSTDGLFSVHLGDIFTAKKKDCDEEAYQHAADLLRKSQLPMLVLPGDKDWMDCDNIKPKKAFDLWSETYVRFEENWQSMNEIPVLVERPPERQENFAFMFRDVLFIGINNGGEKERATDIDKDEYKQREKDVRTWVKLQVKTYEDGPLQAVVIFAHAYRFKDTFQWISERLQEKGVQIFLLHGDGGVFDLNKPLSDNFYEIVLDPVGRAPPIQLTVFDNPPKNIFDRKDTIFVGDSVAINRQGGEY